MNNLILDKYAKLPKEVQAQVLDYIDFLLTKYPTKKIRTQLKRRHQILGVEKD